MINCIKLVKSDNTIVYVSDILRIPVDPDNKTAEIILTTGETEVTLTYTKDATWDRLQKDINSCAINSTPITVYENEDTLQAIIDEEEASRRKPGEN